MRARVASRGRSRRRCRSSGSGWRRGRSARRTRAWSSRRGRSRSDSGRRGSGRARRRGGRRRRPERSATSRRRSRSGHRSWDPAGCGPSRWRDATDCLDLLGRGRGGGRWRERDQTGREGGEAGQWEALHVVLLGRGGDTHEPRAGERSAALTRDGLTCAPTGSSGSGSTSRSSFPSRFGSVELRTGRHPHRCATAPESHRSSPLVSAANLARLQPVDRHRRVR